ncbi:hypothetical protein, partial [Coralloluteibacterium thermophilus]
MSARPLPPPWLRPAVRTALDAAAPCVRCGACDALARADASPQVLHLLALDGRLPEAEDAGLMRADPSPVLDAACPSRIPLSGILRDARDEQRRRHEARARHDARRARLERAAAEAAAR